jgi:hypothetical protein
MELNDAQHKLLMDFAAEYLEQGGTGHIKKELHISQIRQLVEACIQANDEKKKEV